MHAPDIHHHVSSAGRSNSLLPYSLIQSHKQVKKKIADKNLLYAKAILFIVGVSHIVVTLFTTSSVLESWSQLCLGLITLTFGFIASRNPLMSAIIPLVLLSLDTLTSLFIYPASFTLLKTAPPLLLVLAAILAKHSYGSRVGSR